METIKTSAEMIGLIHDFKTQKRISRFCRKQGILWRGLKESDRNRPVAAILYGKIPEAMRPLLPQEFQKDQTEGSDQPPAPMPDFLLLSGLSDGELDRLLDNYRAAGLPSQILKAVVTPTNLFWSIGQVAEALENEHRQMHGDE